MMYMRTCCRFNEALARNPVAKIRSPPITQVLVTIGDNCRGVTAAANRRRQLPLDWIPNAAYFHKPIEGERVRVRK